MTTLTETMGKRVRGIAVESYVMASICLADLATTLFWISYRNASEGNPLMAFFLHAGGTPAFIAAKLVLFLAPLFIAEWARRSRPRFVHAALRVGIIAYVALYSFGVAHVNAKVVPIDEDPHAAAQLAMATYPAD